jgi:hypothetical protein
MDIGCLECGVSSAIVGVFSDRGKAEGLAERLSKTHYWREGGQNSFDIYELPATDIIDPEFLAEGRKR